MSLRSFFTLPPDGNYRSRILQAVCLCVFVFYGYRALQAEILRWGFLAVPILYCFGGLVLAGIVYGVVLLFHGFRSMFTPQPNGLLFFILLIGAFFARYTPEPPLREEVKLFFNRSRYEQLVEQGRSIYEDGAQECLRLADQDQDLSWMCVTVAGNYAVFNASRDVFSLVYSYDEKAPTAPDCDWNGSVWKRIDEHWFICKSSIN